MGKNNGYPGKVILGILILKELMAIGKIAGAGKIIKDGKLMADIGFNLEKIKKAEKEDKGVIDLDTLRNHLKKIPQEDSNKAFYCFFSIFYLSDSHKEAILINSSSSSPFFYQKTSHLSPLFPEPPKLPSTFNFLEAECKRLNARLDKRKKCIILNTSY